MSAKSEPTRNVIVVIAIDGEPRNKFLMKCLKQFSSEFDIFVLSAITPPQVKKVLLDEMHHNFNYLLGRRASDGELATALSHSEAYRHIVTNNYRIGLVLEDDVDISSLKISTSSISKAILDNERVIQTMVKSPWALWRGKGSHLKAIFPPPCAGAYWINFETAKFALSHVVVGLADWPPWADQVSFIYDENFSIPVPDQDSILEDSRKFIQQEVNLKYVLKLRPKKCEVTKKQQIRQILIYRGLWKTYAHWKKIKNTVHVFFG